MREKKERKEMRRGTNWGGNERKERKEMMRGMYWRGNERKGRGCMGGGENKDEKK